LGVRLFLLIPPVTDLRHISLSIQNEPLFSVRWQSLLFDGDSQRVFLGQFLGPQARAQFPNMKIIVHDDQRPFLLSMAQKILSTDDSSKPNAAQYVDGFGVHWYASLNDYINEFGHLTDCHNTYPDRFILATEACAGYLPWEGKPVMGDWSRGELYSYDIIGDLENWASGWVDWNLVLDPQGGPNHVQNFVDSPIIVDVHDKNRFWKQPMFYHMAHFSKFITPGSLRLKHDSQYSFLKQLDTTVWKDPSSDAIIVVLLNRNSWFDVPYQVVVPGCGYYEGTIEKKSIQTLTFKANTC
jgi:glucosylceramidase